MLRRYLRWNAVVSGELPWQLLLEDVGAQMDMESMRLTVAYR